MTFLKHIFTETNRNLPDINQDVKSVNYFILINHEEENTKKNIGQTQLGKKRNGKESNLTITSQSLKVGNI